MNKNAPNQSLKRRLRKHEEFAAYRDPKIPQYQGNPLIEALPLPLSKPGLMKYLLDCPPYDEEQRTWPPELRLQMILQTLRFFTPSDIHYHLAWQIDSAIRLSYEKRNPLDTDFWDKIEQDIESIDSICCGQDIELIDPSWCIPTDEEHTATSLSILGISGVGKSTGLLRILKRYKPVILHSRYGDRNLTLKQISWMKLECPSDGSLKGLCQNFFQKVDSLLGTRYYQKYVRSKRTVDDMIPDMANIAAVHCIGLLVIDEIQNLDQAKSGGAKRMLNFFVQLINTLNISVVLVGTYKAWEILGDEFRQIRRGSGLGDLVWDPMQNDNVWNLFVTSMWRYQYTRKSCSATKALKDVLYYECQGITDYAIKMYLLAQVRAILTGTEEITTGLIKSVARDHFRTAKEVLDALKEKDWKKLKSCKDVKPINIAPVIQLAQKQLDQINQTSDLSNQVEHSSDNYSEVNHSVTDKPEVQPPQQLPPSSSEIGEEVENASASIKTNKKRSKQQEQETFLKLILPEIGISSAKKGITTYQLLQQKGFIKSPEEFVLEGIV
jgi:hypothetical protein